MLYAVFIALYAVVFSLYEVLISLYTVVNSLYAVLSPCRAFSRYMRCFSHYVRLLIHYTRCFFSLYSRGPVFPGLNCGVYRHFDRVSSCHCFRKKHGSSIEFVRYCERKI